MLRAAASRFPRRLRVLGAAATLAAAVGGAACSSAAVRPAAYTGEWDSVAPSEAGFAVEANAPAFHAHEGYFVEGLGAWTTMGNQDLDGDTTLGLPTGETADLHEMDPGTGWGIAFGYRGEANSAQFTYASTAHDGSFNGASSDDQLKCYSLDFKHHWNVERRFQPFLLLGITVPRAHFDDAATSGTHVTDAYLQGLGVNVGGGAALFLSPRVALHCDLYYRWAYFHRLEGADRDRELEERIDGSGFGVRGGLSFTL